MRAVRSLARSTAIRRNAVRCTPIVGCMRGGSCEVVAHHDAHLLITNARKQIQSGQCPLKNYAFGHEPRAIAVMPRTYFMETDVGPRLAPMRRYRPALPRQYNARVSDGRRTARLVRIEVRARARRHGTQRARARAVLG
jgi:hypothetical protein